MAKQNFLSGGFKGKLGEVIGQGWKDQLVLRTAGKYTPSNSERQQEIRSSFQRRVLASKMATQANWRATFFEDGHSGRWGARMKTCSQLFGANKNIIEYCPVIPYGYTPAYTTSEAPEVGGQSMSLFFDTTDDISARQLSVLVWAKNEASGEYDIQLCVANISGSAGDWEATATLPTGYVFDDDSYLVAVSRSDELFNGQTLYQPPVKVGKGVEIRTFTLSNPSVLDFIVGDPSYIFNLESNITLPATNVAGVSATCTGVLQGEFVTGSLTNYTSVEGTVVTLADFTNLDSLGQRPMFVTGSSLTIKRFSFVVDGVKYKCSGGTFQLAETPTTQQFIVPAGSFEYVNSDGYRLVNSNTDWTVSGSATIGLRTIFGSDGLQNETYSLSFAMRNGLCLSLTNEWGFSLFYGQNQSATPTGTTTATRNGVTYALPTDTPITVNPEQTSEEGTIEFATVGNWILNLIDQQPMLQNWGDLVQIYNLQLDLKAYKPDVVELTVDGQPYAITLNDFYYDGTDVYENCFISHIFEGNPPTSVTTATYKVAWTQEKTYVYTVPNSAGFTFTIHFPIRTFEGNCIVWL